MPCVLVAYDIPHDRRGQRVAKALGRLGKRVQWSVYLVWRATPAQIAKVLGPVIEPAEDDVRIHPLCVSCQGEEVLLGKAQQREAPAGFRVV